MTGSHYEISPKEREDEQRRWRDEFDAPDETYHEYLDRTTSPLSERPRAGTDQARAESSMTGASQPGTGRSESRDTKEAA